MSGDEGLADGAAHGLLRLLAGHLVLGGHHVQGHGQGVRQGVHLRGGLHKK